MSEELQVSLKPNKDMLTEQRNAFQKQVIDNTLDLSRHLEILKVDPEYVRENPQNPREVTKIVELVANYRKALVNAQSYVAIIDAMLEADGKDELGTSIENVIEEAKPEEKQD